GTVKERAILIVGHPIRLRAGRGVFYAPAVIQSAQSCVCQRDMQTDAEMQGDNVRGDSTIKLILSLLLLFRAGVNSSVITQPDHVVTYSHGTTVTLNCSMSQKHQTYFSWFRQAVGQSPACILTIYAFSETPTFYGEFHNNKRFQTKIKGTRLSLTISDMKSEDAGIYYCAARAYELVEFGNGIFLMYESMDIRNIIIQHPMTEPLLPGDSVSLQCSVHTETCAGEHSVYWFRQASGESLPGIIYTHGNRSDQCERSSGAGSPTQSCVYKLPKRNLSRSDAGTYYCAVATCGEILFGNGTVVDLAGTDNGNKTDPTLLILVASNVMSVIIIAVLICLRQRNIHALSKGTPQQTLQGYTHSTSSDIESPEEMNYVALNFSRKNMKKGTQRSELDSHVVYTGLRCQKQN
ncbi:hypothetical protein JZ751_006951, partial [Albula glossodonta]